ncbi:hypothetical protein VPH35_015740 [Triticum aestivum]
MLRHVAGAVAAPLRRSLCTAASRSRPPWALTYRMAPLGAPSPGARTSLDHHEPPCVSQLSVPAHLADGMDLAAVSIQAASCDGLLLLDFAGTLRGDRDYGDSLPVVAAFAAAYEPGVRRFVCNPLSGELFRLPLPSMDAEKTTMPFGLLTQSNGSHGPPDRFVVAQLCLRERDGQRVVRRFLSETGEWDEPPLSVPAEAPGWRAMPLHEVHGFVVLPCPLPNLDMEVQLELYRLLGVSEGKLRYVELTIKEPFMLYSFSLDDEGSSWKLTHEMRMNLVLPDKSRPRLDQMPALDLAEGERIGRSAFLDNIKSLYHGFVPLILPAWLPRAGTLSSKITNCTTKTLADMLVRVDKDPRN